VLAAFARRTDALMLALDSSDDAILRQRLQRLGTPVVMMEREFSGGWDAVLTDHAGGAHAATRHLLGLGHRRIALITASADVRPGAQRVLGYTRAFAEAKREMPAGLVRCGSFDSDFAFREASSLLSPRDPPTAIIAGGIQLLAGVPAALVFGLAYGWFFAWVFPPGSQGSADDTWVLLIPVLAIAVPVGALHLLVTAILGRRPRRWAQGAVAFGTPALLGMFIGMELVR